MAEKNSKSWFGYCLMSAWFYPYIILSINTEDNKNIVDYVVTEGEPDELGDVEEKGSKLHTIEIDDSVLQKIVDGLQDERLYKIESIEMVDCFDGCMQDFTFSNGKDEVRKVGFNMGYCVGHESEYPNACLLIDVLKKIGEILIPLGVDARCFELSRKDLYEKL